MISDEVVRRAAPDEGATVLAVLDDAAGWLAGRGVVQWPGSFRPEWIEPGLSAGDVWLVERAGSVVATLTLRWTDPLWPDDGRAGYLHRFAVRRAAAGLGRSLLDWAAGAVRDRGRDRLRLDCGADNRGLRAYYEAAGFAHRGDVEIPSGVELKWSSDRPLLSLYERDLG